jgi:hypothetical protein
MDIELNCKSSQGFCSLWSPHNQSISGGLEREIYSPLTTSSKSTADVTKSLIKPCIESHPNCARSTISFLASRLIEIGELGPQNLKLIRTNRKSKITQYVTLSYCWGTRKHDAIRLESKTLMRFQHGIPFKDLPKTIRESISFTHELGIRHIWVDLLCIIQDSEKDIDKQVAAMGHIYENGYLNLSALSSQSMDQGLFVQRDPLQYCPVVIGQTSDGIEYRVLSPSSMDDSRYLWPVHLRGWIFQERIFSRRTLYFGPYLIWVCQDGIRHEFNSSPSQSFAIGPQFKQLLSQPVMTEDERHSFYDAWHDILHHFFMANLGYQTDKLKAISGVATTIQEHTDWTNIEGLWEPFMTQELL